ncbi:hypothetical protein C8R44DRAFT_737327 [Mycena epipterygia]|nr:hypothetical protein C8R44DRAFT_737327 [Mycena epipterygia]
MNYPNRKFQYAGDNIRTKILMDRHFGGSSVLLRQDGARDNSAHLVGVMPCSEASTHRFRIEFNEFRKTVTMQARAENSIESDRTGREFMGRWRYSRRELYIQESDYRRGDAKGKLAGEAGEATDGSGGCSNPPARQNKLDTLLYGSTCPSPPMRKERGLESLATIFQPSATATDIQTRREGKEFGIGRSRTSALAAWLNFPVAVDAKGTWSPESRVQQRFFNGHIDETGRKEFRIGRSRSALATWLNLPVAVDAKGTWSSEFRVQQRFFNLVRRIYG